MLPFCSPVSHQCVFLPLPQLYLTSVPPPGLSYFDFITYWYELASDYLLEVVLWISFVKIVLYSFRHEYLCPL